MVIVKLVCLNRETKDYDVTSNPTIEGLLNIAGLNYQEGTIYVNNVSVDEMTTLRDNDRVVIANKVKGNLDEQPFDLQIVRIGSAEGVITLPAVPGMSVKGVIQQLGQNRMGDFYKTDGSPIYEMRLGDTGQVVTDDHILNRPSSGNMNRLIMTVKTKGNWSPD